jgi:starch phosphorylase
MQARAPVPDWLIRARELALNLRWTWDRETRDLLRQIYPALWDRIVANPTLVLEAASRQRLEELAADGDFQARLGSEHAQLQRYMAERGWFQQAHPEAGGEVVAYLTAECGLAECLPIYAGGLGILSGDHLKAASALGVPLVGVSLLYQEGYSHQVLDASGWQLDRYPSNDFRSMPVQIERDADGRPLVVEVALPGRLLFLLVWKAQVGRVPLYLLDANVPVNGPSDRGITAQLYGGDLEMRLQQEMALGIGGWRALAAIGLRPQVCHLNEGHAAFAILERARALLAEYSCTFPEALAAAAAGCVFTTHTPVPAGFDRFPPELVARYFGPYAAALGIPVGELIDLGRVEPGNGAEPFGMAVFALRHARSVNGVSQLHAAVSRRLFRPLFPRFPDREIPVTAVTNGIHTDSWLSVRADELLKAYVDPAVDEFPERADWDRVDRIPAAELWAARSHGRQRLVEFARARLRRQLGQRGLPEAEAAARAATALEPELLTIGFARRFATYKRATLFLRDPDRLRRLLLDPERPVQFVVAGKAHPHDDAGKALIQQLFQFAKGADVRHRIVFLEDYDMRVTGSMVQGVDVWLNTPRRPLEASGTSGMKVLPNGGLNCSIRDGWWAEAYEPGVGWAFGTETDGLDPAEQDARDAAGLYEVVERQIVPLFYDRGADGLPQGWIAMMKASMRRLCPVFNTNRMVRQYVEEHYLPAARQYAALVADDLARAKALAEWEFAARAHWAGVRIEGSEAREENGAYHFRARLGLGALLPNEVAVQVYADAVDGHPAEAVPLAHQEGDGTGATYAGQVAARRPLADYTVRVMPFHPDARQPLELPLVTWAR